MNRIANIGLALWLVLDAARCVRAFAAAPTDPTELVMGATLAYLAFWAARRPAPTATRADPLTWCVVVASILIPALWLVIPLPPGYDAGPSAAIRWLATVGIAWSSLALRDAFSVLPQVRRVTQAGPYRFVKHPMYACYLAFDATSLSPHGSTWAVVLWIVELLLLSMRARLEEECLRENSEEYRAYVANVRYRFLPCIL